MKKNRKKITFFLKISSIFAIGVLKICSKTTKGSRKSQRFALIRAVFFGLFCPLVEEKQIWCNYLNSRTYLPILKIISFHEKLPQVKDLFEFESYKGHFSYNGHFSKIYTEQKWSIFSSNVLLKFYLKTLTCRWRRHSSSWIDLRTELHLVFREHPQFRRVLHPLG